MTFSFSGDSSYLETDFNPPIYLDDGDYEIGLSNFESFNLIPNIDEKNNQFAYQSGSITIPTGTYELKDLIEYLQENKPKSLKLEIIPNMNTSTVSIQASERINFSVDNTIGQLLGFKKQLLEPNMFHISDFPVQIIRVNALCIYCSIASGSYSNGKPSHIIHQFFPTVPPGYKIVETPQNILYFPVNVKFISSIAIEILDQNGERVNFRNETISIRLHLRKIKNGY